VATGAQERTHGLAEGGRRGEFPEVPAAGLDDARMPGNLEVFHVGEGVVQLDGRGLLVVCRGLCRGRGLLVVCRGLCRGRGLSVGCRGL
jgi:hypothetical protein